MIALSQSGETEEVLRLIPALRRLGACLIAITERAGSTLGQAADLCVALGPIEEACPLGLAPSASTTVLMAVGDALALLVSRMRDFTADDFALYHPAGSLGRKLARVEEVMRTGRQLRRAHVDETVRARLRAARRPGPPIRSGPDRGWQWPLVGNLHRQRPGAAVRKTPRGRSRPPDRRGHDGRSLSRSASVPRWPRRSS